eukprot:g20801.t1
MLADQTWGRVPRATEGTKGGPHPRGIVGLIPTVTGGQDGSEAASMGSRAAAAFSEVGAIGRAACRARSGNLVFHMESAPDSSVVRTGEPRAGRSRRNSVSWRTRSGTLSAE